MQERPLLLTTLGWLYLITAIYMLGALPFRAWPMQADHWALSPAILLAGSLSLYVATFSGAIMALYGVRFGRLLLPGTVCLGLAYQLLSKGMDVNPFALLDVLMLVLIVIACYGERGREFFCRNSARPRITAQLGTAMFYLFTIFLLAIAMGGLAAWSELGDQTIYLSAICMAIAAVAFLLGWDFGVLGKLKQATGNLLLLSGLLGIVLSLSIYIHEAGGFRAVLLERGAGSSLGLWGAVMTSAAASGLGMVLLSTSHATPDETNRVEPLEGAS